MNISRELYNKTRQEIRCNGNYCLRWMSGDQLELANKLIWIERSKDELAERAKMLNWMLSNNVKQFTIKDLYWLTR